MKLPETRLPYRVLVTPTSYARYNPQLKRLLENAVSEVIYNPLERPLQAPELIPLVRRIDGIIAGLDWIDASVLAAAPRLKVIARYGAGSDRVDLQAATQRGIVVSNTPGANAIAVAELAIGLMLALARQIPRSDRQTRSGGWPRLQGFSVYGKTVGLYGLGAIGRETAKRLAAFGPRLLGVDPAVGAAQASQYGVRLVDRSTLLAESDIISLHCPVNASTHRMVNGRFLAQMKAGAYLVNTARGELVDENALCQALKSGRLAGAALDCFTHEPPGAGNPLLGLPNVIATPHCGAHTDQAANRMGWMALEACLAALQEERPAFVVNPEVYQQHSERTGG